jgi:hypothetical protein
MVTAMRMALALTVATLVVACGGTSQPSPASTANSLQDAAASVPEAAAANASANASEDAAALSMQNIAVSPLALTPAFSPSIHDYYVRCAQGTNALTVSMTAPSGGTIALAQPSTTAPASSGTADLDVAENQAIVINANLGTTATEYWIRCLPHDFPQLSMNHHPGAGTVVPGYYLVGDVFLASGEDGYAMLLDVNGTPVWYGVTSNNAGAKDIDYLEPNTISYVPIAGYTYGTYEGEFELHSLDPVGVSFVTSVSLPVDTHELRRLGNGDFLLFASPVTTGVDLTGLGDYGPDEDILNCVIQEIGPGGEVTWEWTATDHFDIVKESTWPQTASATTLSGEAVAVLDPFHCNSMDVDTDGNILVSSRHMDALFLISKTTGKVMWKMGGAPYNKDGATLVQVTGDPLNGFYRQHDARFQPDGTISLFDDQTSMPGPARAIVVSYDTDAATASIVWQYAGTASVSAMGSFDILPDGSRVVGWGLQGGGNPTFTEVDQNGNDLLDFTFSDGDTSYRALKIPASAIQIDTLRKAVGPWSSPTTAGAGPDEDSGATLDADTAAVGCQTISGSGSTEQCSYSSSTAPGFACASVPGSTAGSCPSSGLYGCCVQTSTNDGAQAIAATCYYDASTGQPAYAQCSLEAYQGMPYRWQTSPP